jgi:hypothetical protein
MNDVRQPQAAETTSVDDALAELKHHWGDAYWITHDEEGWRALRRDELGAGEISADSPNGLHDAIADDYRRKPVPRDLPLMDLVDQAEAEGCFATR